MGPGSLSDVDCDGSDTESNSSYGAAQNERSSQPLPPPFANFAWQAFLEPPPASEPRSVVSVALAAQTTFRWMWNDAKLSGWSKARNGEETIKQLRRYLVQKRVRQVKVEIRQPKSEVEVIVFSTVVAALTYLNDATYLLWNVHPSTWSADQSGWGTSQGKFSRPNSGGTFTSQVSTRTNPSTQLPSKMRTDIESTQWMWGDAGTRVCCSKQLATKNPSRWSAVQSIQETVDQLQHHRPNFSSRPIRINVRIQGKSQIVEYPTLVAALHGLQGTEAYRGGCSPF